MQLWETKYTHQTKAMTMIMIMIMKKLYKAQICAVKHYVIDIIRKILETYNGTVYFK
jgi:hypothetical protein